MTVVLGQKDGVILNGITQEESWNISLILFWVAENVIKAFVQTASQRLCLSTKDPKLLVFICPAFIF